MASARYKVLSTNSFEKLEIFLKDAVQGSGVGYDGKKKRGNKRALEKTGDA